MNTRTLKKYLADEEHRSLALTAVSGLFLAVSWFGWLRGILPFDAAWFSIIISGTPILQGAIIGLVVRRDIKAGLLVSIALIAAIFIGEHFAAGEVAFIMMLGEILENRTVRKAQEGIGRLIQLSPATGRVRGPEGDREVAASEISVGDVLLIKPGESIPIDGEIVSGSTAINQSLITGESMPVDKTIGDEVFVGTINQLGAIEVRATKVGQDTSLSKLIRLVRDAENKKAPVVRLADKMATVIVPLALLLSILTYVFTGDVSRAVTILVVFCPCALVLATPTAIMAGIGNAARNGILIKSGEVMETAGRIDAITFDKTGTITHGKPEIADVISLHAGYPKDELLRIAASAEKFSEHPLGKVILTGAESTGIRIPDPDAFEVVPGMGVKARIDGRSVMVGNPKLLEDCGIQLDSEHGDRILHHQRQGKTVMAVSVEDAVVGLITVADKIKHNAAKSISGIRKLGIDHVLLLTGDNRNAASWVAEHTGIRNIKAEQLPHDKVAAIQSQIREGKKVCMIGDGLNDAPALAIADVGIAMGALGADIAVETADIALMSDDLSKVPELLALARKVMGTVRFNIALSMVINLGAILLAVLGIIGPIAGALIHNLGSILVVMNSATLIHHKPAVESI